MILSIIQARLGSTRLPGKILLPIAGKPMLQHVIDAAPKPKVVAMPYSDRIEVIFNAVNGINLKGNVIYHEGNPNDVLERFYYAWKDFKPEADWILRLTGDCPMLTREIVERFIETANHFDIPRGEYLYTIFTNRPWDVDGMDLELFSAKALKMAQELATDPYDREHVTSWMYRHLNVRRFSVFGREPQPENPEEKVSVDTMEDYEKVKKIMERE